MKTIKPNVSVIIPAFNAANTLPLCIKSLLKQTYPATKAEIIVVNDGSTDNTSTFLSSFPLPEGFKVIHHSKNRGLAAARNTGIKISKGSLIILLDADMEVKENFIEKHVSYHKKNGVVGVVGTFVSDPDNPYDKYQRYIYEAKRGASKFVPNKPLPFHTFIFNNTSINRRIIRKIGLFDEDIKMYGGEDTEYAYRIWKKYPKGLFYDPSIQVIHHHYRTLDQALELIECFGQNVVPYLVKKHPNLAKLYGLSYINFKIDGLTTKKNHLKLLAGFIFRRKTFRLLIKLLYYITPFPLSNYIIRVQMANSLLRGIANYKNEEYKT